MDESLSRLVWALPLVLLLGVAMIWVVKRWLPLLGGPSGGNAPVTLLQTMQLSERAAVHVLHVEGRRLIVIETPSALNTVEIDVPVRRRWADAWPKGRGAR
jgi:flagellar biogenesis protein FliO